MNHCSTWGHPPTKAQARRRAARRKIILVVTFFAALAFAHLATAGANNEIARQLNRATNCGAC